MVDFVVSADNSVKLKENEKKVPRPCQGIEETGTWK